MFWKALRQEKNNITPARLWGIGLSVSYIITVIITGLKF